MKQSDLYDYLQSLMPTLQWVNPYTDRTPLPPVGTNYATFNVMRVDDRGWSQQRPTAYDSNTGIISIDYDVQRIYSVQLDFYGPDAFDNALIFKQTLQVNLAHKFGVADLKVMSEIRNLTFLQENKEFMPRYNFDVDVFVVDTISQTTPAIERVQIQIVNRGNNNPEPKDNLK